MDKPNITAPTTSEELSDDEFCDSALRYLKVKYLEDPESLTELEGGLLLLFQTCKHLALQKRRRAYIEYYRRAYEKAKTIFEAYKAGGTYRDFLENFCPVLPAETDQYVKMLGDIDLELQIIALQGEVAKFEEIQHKDKDCRLTPNAKQLIVIDEERQKLIAAGWPQESLEEEADKRGMFKTILMTEPPPIVVPA
ncbi:MAG: hypothetical protein JEZ11_24650 [Desulfobacterales bacterium]|nr:hypothetical protein [Desulfobacterales bacterium]